MKLNLEARYIDKMEAFKTGAEITRFPKGGTLINFAENGWKRIRKHQKAGAKIYFYDENEWKYLE